MEDARGLMLVVKTSPASRRELLIALEEFRQRVLSESGCLGCRVLEDATHVDQLVWTEWWVDQAHADLATERPRFRALVGAVKLLGTVETLAWLCRREGPDLGTSGREGSGGPDSSEPEN